MSRLALRLLFVPVLLLVTAPALAAPPPFGGLTEVPAVMRSSAARIAWC